MAVWRQKKCHCVVRSGGLSSIRLYPPLTLPLSLTLSLSRDRCQAYCATEPDLTSTRPRRNYLPTAYVSRISVNAIEDGVEKTWQKNQKKQNMPRPPYLIFSLSLSHTLSFSLEVRGQVDTPASARGFTISRRVTLAARVLALFCACVAVVLTSIPIKLYSHSAKTAEMFPNNDCVLS